MAKSYKEVEIHLAGGHMTVVKKDVGVKLTLVDYDVENQEQRQTSACAVTETHSPSESIE